MLSLHLLGGAVLTGPAGPVAGPASHRHRLALLALLALSHPRPLSRDKLIALLWPESDEEHGRSLLNLAVHVVRKVAGDDALSSSGDGLLLDPARVSCDVKQFEAAVAAGDPERAAGLYGGPLLDGFFLAGANEFDRLIERERERLGRLFSGALEALAESRGREGDHQKAVNAWLRLAWAEPFNSRIALKLVQALEAAGDRAGALHHARQHTSFLAEEFGAQPDAELLRFAEGLRKSPPQASPAPAQRMLENLEANLERANRPRISRPDTNPESYNLYLKGRYAWNRRTRESLSQSIRYLGEAVSLNPDHAKSWAALADAYAISGFYDYLPPHEAFPPAREAALRAEELDPSLVQPQVMLGYVALYYDWNLDAAEQKFVAAIERDPTYPVAHQWYGNMLTAAGRFGEALREMQGAIELDPLSLIASSAVGWVHYHAGEFEKCREACQETLQLDGAFITAHVRLGLALDQLGLAGPALEAIDRAVALSPLEPGITAVLAYVQARAGRRIEAEKSLHRLTELSGYLPSYEIAKAYLALGNQDSALQWLRRARDERSHSMALAAVDPQLARLRDNPGFQELLALVTGGPAAGTLSPAPAPTRARSQRSRHRRLLAPLVSVCLGILTLGYFTFREGNPKPGLPAIAILPFTDLSPAGDQAYLAEGISEELINTLARLDGIRVAARTSSFAFRGKDVSIPEVGNRLGVSAVLEGSVLAAGDKVRISAQLVNADDGYTLWSQTYDRMATDVFVIQEDISQAIAQELKVELAQQGEPLFVRPAADIESYNLYLKGRYSWHRRTREGVTRAVDFFRQAAARSPGYARAHAGLAEAYAILGFYDYLAPGAAFDSARSTASRARELDSRLAEPHATLGYVSLYYDWKPAEGERHFREAIRMDPSNSTAHQWYANLLTATRRFDEAAREMKQAEDLDPLSLIASAALGWVYYYAGQNEEAVVQLDRTLELDQNFALAHEWKGWVLLEQKKYQEALAELEHALSLSPKSAQATAALAYGQAVAGQRTSARNLLQQLNDRNEYLPAYEIAKVHLALGEKAAALEWLERAFRDRSHSMAFLRVDPQLNDLRGNVQFQGIVRKVGF